MALYYLMQAVDSVDGILYVWLAAASPDFAAVSYPGPNAATEVAVVKVSGEDDGSGGETNSGANVGAGAGVFRDKTLTTLNFRSLVSNWTGIAFAVDGDAVDLNITDAALARNAISAAASSHTHDGVYSPVGHDHDADYSPLGHTHDATYAAIVHDHDATYSQLGHTHPYLPLTGGSLSGPLSVTSTTSITGPAGTERGLRFQTSGLDRYGLFITATGETGANAGSNLQLIYRADNETQLGVVFEHTRATGATTWNGAFTHTNSVTIRHNSPQFWIEEADAAANGGRWRHTVNGNNYAFQALSDDGASSQDIHRAVRTAGSTSITQQSWYTGGTERARLTTSAQEYYRPVRLIENSPELWFVESDQTTDQKKWRLYPSAGGFVLQTLDDAEATAHNVWACIRTGLEVTSQYWRTRNIKRLELTDADFDLSVALKLQVVSKAGRDAKGNSAGRVVSNSSRAHRLDYNDGTGWKAVGAPFLGADLTDANATINVGGGINIRTLQAGTLTDDRTLTLGSTDVDEGDIFEIVLLDTSGYRYTIFDSNGTTVLYRKQPGITQTVRFVRAGANWRLIGVPTSSWDATHKVHTMGCFALLRPSHRSLDATPFEALRFHLPDGFRGEVVVRLTAFRHNVGISGTDDRKSWVQRAYVERTQIDGAAFWTTIGAADEDGSGGFTVALTASSEDLIVTVTPPADGVDDEDWNWTGAVDGQIDYLPNEYGP